jgi:hypothetical protein|tara:strand:+ start:310 stop:651 length:342 start_codon:yes stop_codon:yes gene_type:complete
MKEADIIRDIIRFKKNDLIRKKSTSDDEPVKFYRVLSVRYWPDYKDAVAELQDITTGDRISLNTRCWGLEMHKEAEEKVFGWVQDKGQHGWQWRDITNTTGLQHIGENKYVEL